MFETIVVIAVFSAGWYVRGRFGTIGDVIAWIKSKFTSTTSGT